MSTLIVALGAAVFVNWYYRRPDTQPAIENEPTSRSARTIPTISVRRNNSKRIFFRRRNEKKVSPRQGYGGLNKTIKDSSATPEAVRRQARRGTPKVKLEADIET